MSQKNTTKPKKKKLPKKIDIYDADHPLRRTAIELIENIIEPLINRGINGERYYQLEDNITETLNKRLNKLLIKPIQADITKQNKIKLLSADPEKDYEPYSIEDYSIEDEKEDFCDTCGNIDCTCK